jgi:hypothetical protein
MDALATPVLGELNSTSLGNLFFFNHFILLPPGGFVYLVDSLPLIE